MLSSSNLSGENYPLPFFPQGAVEQGLNFSEISSTLRCPVLLPPAGGACLTRQTLCLQSLQIRERPAVGLSRLGESLWHRGSVSPSVGLCVEDPSADRPSSPFHCSLPPVRLGVMGTWWEGTQKHLCRPSLLSARKKTASGASSRDALVG